MGKLINLKFKNSKKDEVAHFLGELGYLKGLYLHGIIDKIIIIAQGEEKCCTSNGLNLKKAKEICNDFVLNYKEYVD